MKDHDQIRLRVLTMAQYHSGPLGSQGYPINQHKINGLGTPKNRRQGKEAEFITEKRQAHFRGQNLTLCHEPSRIPCFGLRKPRTYRSVRFQSTWILWIDECRQDVTGRGVLWNPGFSIGLVGLDILLAGESRGFPSMGIQEMQVIYHLHQA